MNYKNHISKIGISNFKVHPLPGNSISLTTSCEDRKNSQRNEEKNDLQKYLNIYESIQKSQLLNSKQKTFHEILQVKQYTNNKNGIFQNPLIQNSCSQIWHQNQNTVTQTKYQIFNVNKKKQSLENSILLPSRKNEMNLKMIVQNKFFSNDKGSSQNKKCKKITQGNWITSSKNKKANICSEDYGNYLNYENSNFSAKRKNNSLDSAQKPYKSYYQTKFQLQYRKPSQSKIKKTRNFILQIDRYIQNKKNRQQIIRPQTSNLRNKADKADIKFFNNKFIDGDQFFNSNASKQSKRYQSKNKFQNLRKSEKKNNNFYNFHKKYYQPLKSFSFHPDDQKQNKTNFSFLKITTESPLAKSVFLTSQQEKQNKNLKIEQFSKSKKSLQKRCIKNGKSNEAFHERSKNNTSSHRSKLQQETSRMTLNKIQQSIANDIQISIRHLDTKA